MECSEFLSRFSEYRDGLLEPHDRAAAVRHLGGCAACRRYERVVREGVELLRMLPAPRLADDFHPRLRHRLDHESPDRPLDHDSRPRPDA